jgi:hypothetical protein
VVGLWLVDLAIGRLFRAVYSVIGVPAGAWAPVAIAIGFAVGAVPSVVAAWLIGRWEGLRTPQLTVTTAVAFLLGLAAGFLVVGPVVTAFLNTANPVVPGVSSAVSGYAITALVGLFGALMGVAVYWLVAVVSMRWFHPRADAVA